MKNICTILLLSLLIVSCKDKNDKNETKEQAIELESTKHEILDHPLIFEDLGLKIVEFSSEETKPDNFIITIVVEADDNEKFQSNHYFFIHAFDFDSTGEMDFKNFDTKTGSLSDNKIVFKKQITTDIYDFGEFRFGLVDVLNKNRYFVRTLKNVSIKE